MVRRARTLVAGLALLAACAGEIDPPVQPEVLGVRTVIPAAGLPDGVAAQAANNNLDVVHHEGRVFFAFRTAPSHFASPEARLVVLSSEDERRWDYELVLHEETDLREPRLLSWDGRLWLYYAVLGTNSADFEPRGMKVTERTGPGAWTEADWFHGEGFIPWRTKVIHDVPYMSAYEGGEGSYDEDAEPIEVSLLTTEDGVTWRGVAEDPVVLRGGASETAFVIRDDGMITAVARNEGGDASGWGSSICSGRLGVPGLWTCVNDPKKYDSPLMFDSGGRTWLVARRNVTEDGRYDLERRDLDPAEQTRWYQTRYWQERKRCALWEVDASTGTVAFVLDLPSAGDTCFPGLLRAGEAGSLDDPDATHVIYNYSSPLDTDPSWLQGQLATTEIHRIELRLPE